MASLPSRHVTVRLEVPFDRAWAFLSDLGNWTQWAAGLGGGFTRVTAEEWSSRGLDGRDIRVRLTPANPFGVLDHTVVLADGATVQAPMRLIRNADACELIFTAFQFPGMDEPAFQEDVGRVQADLLTLKAALEGQDT